MGTKGETRPCGSTIRGRLGGGSEGRPGQPLSPWPLAPGQSLRRGGQSEASCPPGPRGSGAAQGSGLRARPTPPPPAAAAARAKRRAGAGACGKDGARRPPGPGPASAPGHRRERTKEGAERPPLAVAVLNSPGGSGLGPARPSPLLGSKP